MKRLTTLCLLLIVSIVSVLPVKISAQSVSDWTLRSSFASPVKLTDVQESQFPGNESFTFTNTTEKNIVYLSIHDSGADAEACTDYTATGLDDFITGTGIAPKATVVLEFSKADFVVNGKPSHVLRLDAVIFADGSHEGSPKLLSQQEARMLGSALEIDRVLNKYQGLPDQGADAVAAATSNMQKEMAISKSALDNMQKTPVSSEAVDLVKGMHPDGLSPSYIDKILNSDNRQPDVTEGILRAQEAILSDLQEKIALAARDGAGHSKSLSDLIARAQSHGLEDLMTEYRDRNKSQILILQNFDRASDTGR